MDAVRCITAVAAALLRDNIDTDIIIPSREISSPTREGFGAKLFAPWRYSDDGTQCATAQARRPENRGFVLNQGPWRQAGILMAGANFGCGSSREMAVWALLQFGIRCVIAPSFGAIFRDNAVRNGLLPVALPADCIDDLARRATDPAAPLVLTVDLEACRISGDGIALPFGFDAHEREMLLQGLDAIALTWRRRAEIEAFEAADRRRRPWIWRAAPAVGADPDPAPDSAPENDTGRPA
jgi:3-isopropylmalate/(R)-2-methylmalate dehydratase small subunit